MTAKDQALGMAKRGSKVQREQMFFCNYSSCPLQECPHMIAMLIKHRSSKLPRHMLRENDEL